MNNHKKENYELFRPHDDVLFFVTYQYLNRCIYILPVRGCNVQVLSSYRIYVCVSQILERLNDFEGMSTDYFSTTHPKIRNIKNRSFSSFFIFILLLCARSLCFSTERVRYVQTTLFVHKNLENSGSADKKASKRIVDQFCTSVHLNTIIPVVAVRSPVSC